MTKLELCCDGKDCTNSVWIPAESMIHEKGEELREKALNRKWIMLIRQGGCSRNTHYYCPSCDERIMKLIHEGL